MSGFKKCVHHTNDTHKLWVMCLGVAQAWEALAGAGCAHCDVFTWCLPLSSTGLTDICICILDARRGTWLKSLRWVLSLPQSLVASSDALVLNLGGQHSASSSSAEGLSVGQSGSEELDVMGGRGGHYIWACLLFVTSVWRAAGHNARLLDWNWTGWWRNRSPLQADWMSASWWVIRICLLRDFRSSLSCMTSSASHGGTHFCLRLSP